MYLFSLPLFFITLVQILSSHARSDVCFAAVFYNWTNGVLYIVAKLMEWCETVSWSTSSSGSRGSIFREFPRRACWSITILSLTFTRPGSKSLRPRFYVPLSSTSSKHVFPFLLHNGWFKPFFPTTFFNMLFLIKTPKQGTVEYVFWAHIK